MKKTVRMIDPPSGWKYGFPRMIPDGIEDHRQFILDCGYPQEELDSYGKYFYVRYWDAEVKDENGSTVS